jgi:hypothetical protein
MSNIPFYEEAYHTYTQHLANGICEGKMCEDDLFDEDWRAIHDSLNL